MPKILKTETIETDYIGSNGNNIFDIQRNNSSLIRLSTADRVGIGTTSPAYRLTVQSSSGTDSQLGLVSTSQTINTGGKLQIDLTNANNQQFEGGSILIRHNSSSQTAGAESCYMAFQTRNSGSLAERLRIDSSGNVGIGRSPSYALDVYKSGATTSRISALNDNVVTTLEANGSTAGYSGTLSNHPFGIITNNTARLLIDSSGNVGVGTTSPSDILHVSKTNGVSIFESSGISSVGIRLRTNSLDRWQIGCPSGSADLAIYTGAASTERLRIDSSGNVGIGTSTAGARLTVDSGSVGQYARFNSTSANGGYLTLESSGTVHGDIGTAAQVVSGGSASDFGINARGARNLILGTNNTERLRIDLSGRVGIGTSSPSYPTDIVADSNAWALNLRGRTVDNLGYIRFSTNNGATNYAAVGTPAANTLALDTNGTERLRIDSSGNVLVGTTSNGHTSGEGIKITPSGDGVGIPRISIVTPSTTNAQNSGISFYSTGAAAYRFYVGAGGTVFATNTTISAISDIRYKENIRDLNVGLGAIMALRPRVFDWKDGKGKNIKNDRGFIAQEFEQVFPDLIDEWKDDAPQGEEPYKSVRQDLIPVLVKAIQELKFKNDILESKVAALEAA